VNTTVLRARNPASPTPQAGSGGCGSLIPVCPRKESAFTLLELLVVIAILGILAAISAPTLNSFKPNVIGAASLQLLADIGRARQLAIINRTTVYMVFVPTNFFDAAGPYTRLPVTSTAGGASERDKADKLLDKQLIAYNYVSLRSLGEQPGVITPRYLSSWKTLPEGTFISLQKFAPRNATALFITNQVTQRVFRVNRFPSTNNIPFPSEMTALYPAAQPYVELPYIGFNYLGQLVSGQDEVIPLGRGNLSFGKDAAKNPTKRLPTLVETPPGNTTNSSFNLIYIDWLTGRGRVERQEVR
jgi:prepilin-type N-terminal cleavage/methylation domain-containing protein